MNKPTILVVEDDSSVRSLITTTLKAHGYKFLTAANGEMAVMMASSHNPDIMLLDLGLPDIDGVEVIRRIREWSNLPIIVLSARSEDSDKIEALDQGADDYLTKPFSVDELLARLRVTQRRLNLQASGEVGSSVFVNGPLKIDFAAGKGLEECLACGNACGALNVTAYGGNTGFPDKEGLKEFMGKKKGEETK